MHNEAPERTQAPTPETAREGVNIGRIGLAVACILIGLGYFGRAIGVLPDFQLDLGIVWPVALILVGLSLISLRGWKLAVMSIVAVVLVGGLVAVAMFSDVFRMTAFQVTENAFQVQKAAATERVSVSLDTGAANVSISGIAQEDVLSGSVVGRKVSLESAVRQEGATQFVDAEIKRERLSFSGIPVDMQARVTTLIPVELSVHSGASDVRIDASELRLERLNIDSGASSIDVTLGAQTSLVRVAIDAGASRVQVRVPREVGIRVEYDGGLSRKQLADLQDAGDDAYQSEGYADAAKKAILQTDIGASSLEIERY